MLQIERKHIKQMNSNEVEYLNAKLNKNRSRVNEGNLLLTKHSVERLNQRGKMGKVTKKLLIEAILDSHIIEYGIARANGQIKDEKILLKSNKSYKGYSLVVSYSLMTNKVITMWFNYNKADEKRVTDYSIYNKNMPIIGVC